ncbi:beta-lactamase family protein [Flavihumibacter rivuli]|uniref:serine hydrolase domain-containing protein n=1 Tax=Flavihumibacter rivuli TaxID=2838156 RepID=UPI001D4BA3DA|nr:serine hydrolase domain-containing protein [Flavihumibacter rivuli]ULQ57719.1 beta-lactamase family protein [Flavihumibacter rivuli]
MNMKLKIGLIAGISILAITKVIAQSKLEKTAASFIELHNSGDTAAYRQYLVNAGTSPDKVSEWMRGYANAYRMLGKVSTRKIISTSPVTAEAWVQDNQYDAWWKFTIYTDSVQQFKRRTIEPVPFTTPYIQKGKLSTAQVAIQIDQYITGKLGGAFSGNVLVVRDKQQLYFGSFGNNGDQVPNTRKQLFGLASMGKMFTAIGILQLRGMGLLSLEDTVGKFLPGIKNNTIKSITIRQLLNHSSGMGDFFNSPVYAQIKDSIRGVMDMLPVLEADKLAFEPGKGWQYSNNGYCLLGIILEQLGRKPFGEYIKTHIFDPAGMVTAEPGDGAGGGRATVDDMLAFAQALQAGKLLSDVSKQELLEYRVNDHYGMGMEHQQLGKEHIVGHSGGYINQCTELNMYLKEGYIVVILSNSNPPFGHFVSNKIKELLVRS